MESAFTTVCAIHNERTLAERIRRSTYDFVSRLQIRVDGAGEGVGPFGPLGIKEP